MTRLAASKAFALAAVTLLGAGALLAWSQTWFVATLAPGNSLDETVSVGGDAAAPALVPLSLAVLAVVAALAIARPIVRRVLACVLAALGIGIAAAGVVALSDPLAAVATSVTASTGLDGDRAVDAAVLSVDVSLWPAVTIAIGAALTILALALVFTSRLWGGDSQRHEAPKASTDGSSAAPSHVSDWDSLSSGDDPTSAAGSR